MKCKVCGGTGTSNTCVNGTFKPCTFCDGTGEYEPFDEDIELDKLHPTEQTNEEWRRTCSAKEFAKWLKEICLREQYNDGESMSGWYEEHNEKYWEKWLKKPHTEK